VKLNEEFIGRKLKRETVSANTQRKNPSGTGTISGTFAFRGKAIFMLFC